jgi:hypothetical protein
MNLKKGDTLVILEGNPAEFVALNPASPLTAPFKHSSGVTVTATPVEYVVISDDRISTSQTSTVTDANGTIARNLVGARPRNIVRK